MSYVRKTISVEEHEDIAPQLLEMHNGLDDMVYALFLSYPLDAPANQAVRRMRDDCYTLRKALQAECGKLSAEADTYKLIRQPAARK